MPEYYCKIANTFILEDVWICGIAPHDTNQVVILAMPKADMSIAPSVLIVEPVSFDEFTLVCTDVMTISGTEGYSPKDYDIKFLIEDQHYFIVSPKEVILGKPRDTDDHIDYLLSKKRFADALECIAEEEEDKPVEKQSKASTSKTTYSVTPAKRNTMLSVGQQYFEHLLEIGEFEKAGRLCVRILGRDKDLWQDVIYKFARLKQLKAVAPCLPVGNDPNDPTNARLDSHVYEMVLQEFLKSETEEGNEGFLELVRNWPPELYSISGVVNVVVEKLLGSPDDEILLRSLATLFSYQQKYEKAMAMYLKLGHRDVFDLIRNHKLYDSIHDKVEHLFELDHKLAIELFIDNIDTIEPEYIVEKLHDSKYLFWYLDAIKDHRDKAKSYYLKLIELYADFEPDRLLYFLSHYEGYNIEKALEITEIRGKVIS